jgi:hypothetical protein
MPLLLFYSASKEKIGMYPLTKWKRQVITKIVSSCYTAQKKDQKVLINRKKEVRVFLAISSRKNVGVPTNEKM